jgi:DNA (cytosine-5)-methyltransferase 1
MTEHKLLDLFSGIGGFSYAAEQFGIKTIGFVEKDEFCQKVLKKHWKNVPIESDIRNVKGDNYGTATIVSGGFPCQPFSVAGKRKGQDDDRYLWDETIRVVAECKPRWFIGENVDGLVNIQEGMVLRQVQDDLEKEGFQVQCLVIPASGVGAWHQRKRVWIIGHNVSNSKISSSYEYKAKYTKENEIQKQIGGESSTNNVSDSNSESWNEFSNDNRFSKMPQEKIFRNRNSIQESARFRSWWEIECKLCGVPHGVSYELDKGRVNRLKALGNSIVPQIAEQLFKSIIYAEQ